MMKEIFKNGIITLCSIAVSYIVSVCFLKIVDTILCIGNNVGLSNILYSFISNFIGSSLIVLGIGIIFFLLLFWSEKVARCVGVVLGAFAFICEVGMDVFSLNAGVLLGSELFARPFGETIHTINASVGLWLYVFLILSVVYIVAMFFVSKKVTSFLQRKKTIKKLLIILILLGMSFSWTLHYWQKKSDIPRTENYITHKLTYFLESTFSNFGNTFTHFTFDNKLAYNPNDNKIDVRQTDLNEFVLIHNNRKVIDKLIPLEHENADVEDVLSPFFKESDKKPNIVILVVESLGREWSGNTDLGISYTPFLDSLMNHSLYWSNCLSTTKRSFGAVPTITGSLPHGPKGFQFGNMPDHNSLLSMLKQNGYQTNAFYASDFTFDAIQEYLTAQQIDYMSTGLKQECFDKKNPCLGTYWGYHDEFMFDRSFEIMNDTVKQPYCNLYVTISAHDAINEKNCKMDSILEITRSIISKLPKERQVAELKLEKRIATIVYTDYALRQFFAQYSQREDFQNTIFVITGDHSAELDVKNRLGLYHVPLFIYSPLLSRTGYFKSIVSHCDIAPSIVKLMENKYGVSAPGKVSWIGKGLDTSASFHAKSKILMMDYAHDIGELLYDEYFYFKEKDAVYRVDENLNMEEILNDEILSEMRGKLDIYKYVNNYVYLNNAITTVPINSRGNFKNFVTIQCSDMECVPAPEAGSKNSIKYWLLQNENVVKDYQTTKIRVAVTADMRIEGETWQDKQMSLCILCKDEEGKVQLFSDKIVKFVLDEQVEADKWYKMQISKEIDVAIMKESWISVYVQTPKNTEYWTDNNKLFLKNIKVYIDKNDD